VHLHNPFDPREREIWKLERSVTVRRLVARRRELRRHTSVRRSTAVACANSGAPTVCVFNGEAADAA
jgi:hypothetical protein